MATIGSKLADLTVGEALITIIIGWILVAVWQRFLDNLMYNKLGMEKSDAYSTGIVALIYSIIFVAFISVFGLASYSVAGADIGPI